MVRSLIILVLSFATWPSWGQVDDIKAASKSSSSQSRSTDSSSNYDASSGSGSGVISDVIMFLPHWQRFKLYDENRLRYPPTTSLDILLQGAYKPSDTYILTPRIRGNWGLFSTDFRMNYMIEKNDAGGISDLKTNDWQILQLNVITSRFITMRFGMGTMTENFSQHNQYTEVTVGFGIHAPDHSDAFFMEYRDAFTAGGDYQARLEFNANYQHQIFKTRDLHGYLSAGMIYQKYYGTIDFWGLQAGLVLRLFRDVERQ